MAALLERGGAEPEQLAVSIDGFVLGSVAPEAQASEVAKAVLAREELDPASGSEH